MVEPVVSTAASTGGAGPIILARSSRHSGLAPALRGHSDAISSLMFELREPAERQGRVGGQAPPVSELRHRLCRDAAGRISSGGRRGGGGGHAALARAGVGGGGGRRFEVQPPLPVRAR